MRCLAIFLGAAPSDHRMHQDEGRSVIGGLERVDGPSKRLGVIGVVDDDHIPAIAPESRGGVLGKGEFGVAFDRDRVAVIDPAEVGELEMAGQRGGFARHALHHVSVSAQHEDVMIEQLKLRPVEMG